ncbi:MAG TPA: NADH-quinone oxidoreductase subunit L [Egicoccus sp.]|nr:NADH-quinone oxidoreductase subunit L [Egicoccus sp.]HSK22459.1 NADH-quinone oxidoreductase subunit L [Egicoccus sp.]
MEALLDYAWLVVMLPLAAAVLTAAFGRLMPMRGSEVGIALVGVAWVLSALIAWQTFTSGTAPPVQHSLDWAPLGSGFVLEIGMLVDGLTSMMFLLVTTVSLLVHIYSREYMAHEPRFTYFFAMLGLFTFSMLLLVIANNTLQALIGWELVGVCSFLLIGFYWEEKSNQDAANKAFLVTKFGDVGLIVGVIVLSIPMFEIADGGKVFNILALNEAAAAGEIGNSSIVLGMLLIFLACVSKSGQMPLHVWLPDAMAGPTPVSALIHAATMVTAGVFLLARLYPVMAQSATVMAVIAIVGVITLFFGGLVALVQDDIKKVLAYSTVSQLGYMVAALGVGGYTAGIFHLFTHGFFKALLFLGSGSLIHAVHSNNMSDMGGMRKYMPHTFWTFIVGSLALAGFPMTAGFFSKDEILVSGQIWADNGYVTGDLVFWVGLAAAFVTTFYMARACFLIFGGEFRGGHDTHGDPDVKHQAAQVGGPREEDQAEGVDPEVAGHEEELAHAGAPATATLAHDDHGGGHDDHGGGHHAPHESGPQMVVPLVILAVLSLLVGYIGSPVWGAENSFETWTATPILEEATYPFLDHGDDGHGEEAEEDDEHALQGGGVLAGGPVLAAEGGGTHPEVLHGPPSWHLDVLGLAMLAFFAAVGLAFVIYGRGRPAEDPTMKMGPLSRVLIAKYGLDTLGYKAIVVPVRDKLSAWASYTSNEVIDKAVAGVGIGVKRAATTTYQVVDQRVIDGGVNGAAFSAAWWSDRLKRMQSGDVQRYAGAIVAGTIVLVLAFAAAR